MTHQYAISGMTCSGCEAKVKGLLGKVDGVKEVRIDLKSGVADVDMTKHVGTGELRAALKDYPKYQLTEKVVEMVEEEEKRSWLETYKPVLLILGYVTVVAVAAGRGDTRQFMRVFMAGFFLSFSFFKLLNLSAFADSYSMYDIVARRWRGWGYLYAFVELGLGVAFVTGVAPFWVNLVTLVVMTVSIIGVLQSVLNKKKIKCACLGAVFNLPMSTVTILEDALMIGMSVLSLVMAGGR
ncbi:heavy-metal-associated domain-containing protein [Puia sp. P3]|uniref:heavy-metal-associated domain-containing protein n=1 Tax=Puia sp. P3 TaxID=3423952 RepID=UPI003D679637